MATSWLSYEIRCPYFQDLRDRTIFCEGVHPGSVMQTTFRRLPERENVMAQMCTGDFRKCGLYRSLEAKYGQ